MPFEADPYDNGAPEAAPLEDDFGEAVLAQQLGIAVVAAVEPCPDSQIPPDTMDLSTPAATELDSVESLAPTEIEATPPAPSTGERVKMDEPLPIEIKGDPMPSRDKYSAEDLGLLRERIAQIKWLSLVSV